MENRHSGSSGQGNPDRQPANPRDSHTEDYNPPHRQTDNSKFAMDQDDFSQSEDVMDNERNLSASETEHRETRNSTGTNDMGRSQSTNTDEDSLNSDWNKRSL